MPIKLNNCKNVACHNFSNNGNWYGLNRNTCASSSFNEIFATMKREYPINCYSYFCKKCYEKYYENKDLPKSDDVYKKIMLKDGKMFCYILPFANHSKYFTIKYNDVTDEMDIYDKSNKYIISTPLLSIDKILQKPLWTFQRDGYLKTK
tara:strand:- start:198 stop:644 length:447 start_codon:yes stop_codon:yes gene_type:complete